MRRLHAWLLLLILLLPSSCGAPGPTIGGKPGSQPANPPDQTPPAPQRTTLRLSYPSLGQLPAGAEFEAKLEGELSEPVFQGSARLIFNERFLAPLSAARGEMVPAGAVFFSKVNVPGIVPLAFTMLPGDSPLGTGSGDLARVRFRVLAPMPAGERIRLLNDAAFLQLRDETGRRLSFDLATEEAAR